MGTTSPLIPLLPKKTVDNTALPDTSYVDAMRKISQGDLRSVLTGGDRLMALSGLLGSVARGSRTTPQEAMAQVQQAALGRASLQMQLAQLQAAADAKAKREATLAAFANTLPEDKRQTFLALPAEEQNKMLSENVNPTPFQMKEVNGKTYMVFRSGDKKEIDLPADVKGVFQEIDYNKDGVAEKVFVDERTGQPILNAQGQPLVYGLGMTPAQRDASARGWADYGLSVKRFNRGDGAGDSPSLLPEPKEVELNGKKIMMQWDKKSQRYVPFTQQNISKPSSGFRPSVPPSVGVGIRKPLIQQ